MYSREWVSSYEMKHTVEFLLGPIDPYISNGSVILAATMIGLPIVRFDESSPNVSIGVHRSEHDHLRRLLDGDDLRSDHNLLPATHVCTRCSSAPRPVSRSSGSSRYR